VSADRPLQLTNSELVDNGSHDAWLADNLLHPFVNGTGLLQVYDTLANKPLDIYKVPAARTFSTDWCVQSLASAGGAIIPYVVAGKLTGMGLRAAGESLGLQGAAARFVTSESVAQIAGAGLYSLAQKPAEGGSRLAAAGGTMAGFAAFAGGNYLLNKTLPALENPVARAFALGAGRFAVGAAGGLSSYEGSNFVLALQGMKHHETWSERAQSMAQGGFVNLALPVIQEAADEVIDYAIYSRSASKGMPIERELKARQLNDPELLDLAENNPLARVKHNAEGKTEASVKDNVVFLDGKDGNALLAHELAHISLARVSEPYYRQISELSRTNPEAAEKAYYALRANMESSARAVEARVEARADGKSTGAAAAMAEPETLGSQQASGGKTYSQIWKAEWQQFKDNPEFRPSLEFAGKRDIVQSTSAFEKWMAEKIKIVPEDLSKKHTDMASDPFKFMRATYYRWAETFPELCPDLAGAPSVNSVGDLHIDNFGTWTDKKGRLVWGVNDFDESSKQPYTNDLVRLVTSANLLMKQEQLKIGLQDASQAVLEGYRQGLADGGKAFVEGEGNHKLFEIARDQLAEPDHYWHHLKKQVQPVDIIPQKARDAMNTIIPPGSKEIKVGQRQAGEGSLGRQRYVSINEAKGETFAAESKALLPSAADFAAGKGTPASHLTEIMDSAVRDPDPYVGVRGNWVVRSLAPNRTKIELGELTHKGDELRLLYSMGYETANVHLGTRGAADAILKDLGQRNNSWLVDAARTMTKSVQSDQSAWQSNSK
jgi:hypothetical protein